MLAKLLECFYFSSVSFQLGGVVRGTHFFSCAYRGRIVLAASLPFSGDGHPQPVFCYKITKLLFSFGFGPGVAKQIFFPCPLYCDAAKKKNNINSYERRKPPCWGLSQGPLFPSVSFGAPLQSPHPQPCPQRACLPSHLPQKSCCSPIPVERSLPSFSKKQRNNIV